MKLGKRLPATESVVDEDVDSVDDVDEDVDSEGDDDDDNDADVLPHRRALPGECACAVPQAPLRLSSAVACGVVLGLRSECGRSLMWECERRGDLTTGRAAASAVVP